MAWPPSSHGKKCGKLHAFLNSTPFFTDPPTGLYFTWISCLTVNMKTSWCQQSTWDCPSVLNWILYCWQYNINQYFIRMMILCPAFLSPTNKSTTLSPTPLIRSRNMIMTNFVIVFPVYMTTFQYDAQQTFA